MDAQFELGQKVKAVAFTDCFGKFHPEQRDLVVVKVTLIEAPSMNPYYRVLTYTGQGLGCVEGAERFFAPQAV